MWRDTLCIFDFSPSQLVSQPANCQSVTSVSAALNQSQRKQRPESLGEPRGRRVYLSVPQSRRQPARGRYNGTGKVADVKGSIPYVVTSESLGRPSY